MVGVNKKKETDRINDFTKTYTKKTGKKVRYSIIGKEEERICKLFFFFFLKKKKKKTSHVDYTAVLPLENESWCPKPIFFSF